MGVMFDPTITAGAVITMVVAILGFVGSVAVNAAYLGRYMGVVNTTLAAMERRMGELEGTAKEQTHIMVELARYSSQVEILSKRIDDVQKYGSHRLAEVLDAIRGQITSDFKERFEFLQKELERMRSP